MLINQLMEIRLMKIRLMKIRLVSVELHVAMQQQTVWVSICCDNGSSNSH